MIKQRAEMSIVITLAKVIRLIKDRYLKAKENAFHPKPEALEFTARGH
jgi:hypothetical protein